MLSPYDYIFCPVSKDLAIASFSVFYKFFNNKSDICGLLLTNGMTINGLLGFGSSEIVEPPKVKRQSGIPVSYEYVIKQLSKNNVYRLNAEVFNASEYHFGYGDLDKIKSRAEYYNSLPTDKRRYDLGFMEP